MYRILAVDDEPAVLKDLQGLAEWESINTELAACVTSAPEALEILGRERIDILITDVRMPQMDGLTLIARARQGSPGLRCIVVSAHDDFTYVRDALRLGVENYLLKPINPGELTETLIGLVRNLDEARRPAEELAFRGNLLDRWVNGAIQDSELLERASLLGLELNWREFAVVLADTSGDAGPEERLGHAIGLAEDFRSRLGRAFDAETFVDGRARAVAVLRGSPLGDRHSELEQLVRQGIEAVAGASARCLATVGPRVSSAFAVSRSYRVAHLLQGCRYLLPGARIVFADDFPRLSGPGGSPSSVAEIRFRQALDDLDDDGAARIALERLSKCPGRIADAAFREALPLLLHLADWLAEGRASRELPADLSSRLQALGGISDLHALAGSVELAVREAVREVRGARNSIHPLVRQVLDLVLRSFHEELCLKTLAARFNVNPSYLGQLLKAHTGRLFHELLTEARMREARTLLLATDLKIADIAARTGIPQQSYFNRVFRKAYDMTPLEYRRLYSGTAGGERPGPAR